ALGELLPQALSTSARLARPTSASPARPGREARRGSSEGGPGGPGGLLFISGPSRQVHVGPLVREPIVRGRNAVICLQHSVRHRGRGPGAGADGRLPPGDLAEEWNMKVLVIEDHAKLATTMATGLRRAGMAVDVVFDGEDALERLAVTSYDVV